METELLTIREYQTATEVPLSSDQRDLLAGLNTQIVIRPSVGFDDRYDLTPGSKVGVVEVPGLSIQIQPKLSIERVLFLISYSTGNLEFSSELAHFEKRADIFEAIVAGFARQLRRAFRPGILQSYRSEEDALPTVRGRIRFEAQIRDRLGVMPPIEVRYDDFTEDIDENRILKAALTRLGKMRLRSERSRAELRSFQAGMARVSDVEYGRLLPEFSFNRLNARYEPAIRLAELILRSTSFDLGHGSVNATAFLVDMNNVFENFVVEALRDELRVGRREFPQGAESRGLKLDEGGRVSLKPDISWWDGKRCTFVGDVKYKKTRDHRVPNADLYQLLAYTTATGLSGGVLIYASGEDEPGIHVVRNAGKELHVVALDLAGPPAAVLTNIAEVADLIRGLRSRARSGQAA